MNEERAVRFNATPWRQSPHGYPYDASYEVLFRSSETAIGFVNRETATNVGERGGAATAWIAQTMDGHYVAAEDTRKTAVARLIERFDRDNGYE